MAHQNLPLKRQLLAFRGTLLKRAKTQALTLQNTAICLHRSFLPQQHGVEQLPRVLHLLLVLDPRSTLAVARHPRLRQSLAIPKLRRPGKRMVAWASALPLDI